MEEPDINVTIHALARRVAALEAQVAALGGAVPAVAARPAPADSAPGWSQREFAGGDDPEIVTLLREGNLIEAIKVQREKTGGGLAEARDAVEALRSRLGL